MSARKYRKGKEMVDIKLEQLKPVPKNDEEATKHTKLKTKHTPLETKYK